MRSGGGESEGKYLVWLDYDRLQEMALELNLTMWKNFNREEKEHF